MEPSLDEQARQIVTEMFDKGLTANEVTEHFRILAAIEAERRELVALGYRKADS